MPHTESAGMLLLTLLLPLFGFIAVLFIDKAQEKAIRFFTMLISLLTFGFSLPLWFSFNNSIDGFQFYTNIPWISSTDSGFRIGIDGMSLLLVMLTTFIMPIALLSSFEPIKKRVKEYYAMMLLLELGMLGVFISLDTMVFYVFWELILIPMYFLIGIWGGKDRIYAAVKFFLYTLVGSLLMLLAIVWLGLYAKGLPGGHFTTDFLVLREIAPSIPMDIQIWLFLAFALSFCIKVPLMPFHTWLPDAHVQAPTAGSVILAGVLLKMGTYGLIRFNVELFPMAMHQFAVPIAWLSVAGIIYGALVAMVQTDIKKLVAYSSVSHLGFVVLGIASMTPEGLQGAIIQMVNHGLSTGMLFLCVGALYERRHTREISEFGGITQVMPKFAVFFVIAILASVGLPGLNGFIGEFLTLSGAFQSQFLNNSWLSILSTTGVIFSAVYLLWMFQKVMFGTNDNPSNHSLKDLHRNEYWQLVPMVIFIVWIGIYPSTFMSKSELYVQTLIGKVEKKVFGTTKLPLVKAATSVESGTSHEVHGGH